jgi:hypothetical protein
MTMLDESSSVTGHVLDSSRAAVSGAVVTLYRLIAEPDSTRDPKRVAIAEALSGADGQFHFGDLARERHQVLAFHIERGRAEGSVDADGADLQLILRTPARSVGVVRRDGVAVAGVRVATVPDLAQFMAVDDVTELAGGESETDRDGRFSVAMPARGTVELRVGNETAGVRRLVLGDAASLPAVVDVGTIDLTPLPLLTLVLEESAGCELLLAGPVGRAGLTSQRATRQGPSMFDVRLPEPGSWLVSATCSGRIRDLAPALIDLATDAVGRTVVLTWR